LFAKIEAEDMDLAKKSFEENEDFMKYEDFHNPLEGKLYGGEYYTTIKTGKELLEQYFNREEQSVMVLIKRDVKTVKGQISFMLGI